MIVKITLSVNSYMMIFQVSRFINRIDYFITMVAAEYNKKSTYLEVGTVSTFKEFESRKEF